MCFFYEEILLLKDVISKKAQEILAKVMELELVANKAPENNPKPKKSRKFFGIRWYTLINTLHVVAFTFPIFSSNFSPRASRCGTSASGQKHCRLVRSVRSVTHRASTDTNTDTNTDTTPTPMPTPAPTQTPTLTPTPTPTPALTQTPTQTPTPMPTPNQLTPTPTPTPMPTPTPT